MVFNNPLSFSIIKYEKLIKKARIILQGFSELKEKFSQYGCQKKTSSINSTTSVPLFITLVIGNGMKVIG